ncbi:MAG: hypothetical protein IJD79_07260 [Clostridia bacterium]|nr:hypothetical protein [Clostridia bacterium]
MTEKLYYIDAYIKEFDATVVSVEQNEKGYDIVLDKTAFFPEGGGQYSDKGFIDDAEIYDVQETDGIMHHYSKTPINVNKCVHCVIDFDERFDKMQQHTAEHIISGLFHSIYGVENTGFHLGAETVTLDTSRPVTKEELATVERLVNIAIQKNVKVSASFPSQDVLHTLDYRSKLDLKENVRIVDIEGYDSCACCAPHVNTTGEIGLLKFVCAVKHKGGSRITMLAGMRAYDYVNTISCEASAISVMLSAPADEISTEVQKLLNSRDELSYKLSSVGKEMAELIAGSIAPTDKNTVLHYSALDYDALRCLMNLVKEKVGGILVGIVGDEGNYRYILMSERADFADIVKSANSALSGRGGGRAPMASGTFSATEQEIKKYFKNI